MTGTTHGDVGVTNMKRRRCYLLAAQDLHVGEVALLLELSKLGFTQSQLRPPLEICTSDLLISTISQDEVESWRGGTFRGGWDGAAVEEVAHGLVVEAQVSRHLRSGCVVSTQKREGPTSKRE